MEMIYLSKLYQVLNTKEAFQGKKEYFNRTKHDHRLLGEERTLNFISGKQGCCRRPLKKYIKFSVNVLSKIIFTFVQQHLLACIFTHVQSG